MSALLDAEQVEWIESGVVSMVAASHDERLRPSLGLVHGCQFVEGRSRVRIFCLEARSRDLLSDLRAGREVSVLFTQSSTTRALQLKAASAREVALPPGHLAFLDEYARRLTIEWGLVGQPDRFTQALMSRAGDTLCAFELEPTAAFDQTPGPRAGSHLGGAA